MTIQGSTINLILRLRGGGGQSPEELAMGLAPGGLIKQCIIKDNHPSTIWERDQTICFNVQILNSDTFQQATGVAPPPTPISAKTYAAHGLPFFKIYGETSTIKGDFPGVKSVKALDRIKNENGEREKEDHDAHVLKKKPKESECKPDECDITGINDDNGDSEDHGKSSENDSEPDDYHEHSDDDDSNDEDSDDDDDDDDNDEQPLQNPVILLNPNGSAIGKFTPISELLEELSRMKLRKSELLSARN